MEIPINHRCYYFLEFDNFKLRIIMSNGIPAIKDDMKFECCVRYELENKYLFLKEIENLRNLTLLENKNVRLIRSKSKDGISREVELKFISFIESIENYEEAGFNFVKFNWIVKELQYFYCIKGWDLNCLNKFQEIFY